MPELNLLSRRRFLGGCAAGIAAVPAVRCLRLAAAAQDPAAPVTPVVRFGAFADPHHGYAPDADRRLTAFVDAAVARSADLDFVIQLGDFCHPTDEAREFVADWNRFPGPKHHVLGNHDMDKGSKDDAMTLWGMPRPSYAFDSGPFHFVVLDLNHVRDGDRFVPYANANFYVDEARRAWCDPAQLEWLAADLRSTPKPTIVFSHQPLGMEYHGGPLPPQQTAVLRVLQDASRDPGAATVVACICGHLHVDRAERLGDLYCLCVNSASYHYAGGRRTYADPLFAFFTLYADGRMLVEGARSRFVDAHPWADGLSRDVPGVTASIADRAVVLQGQAR